MRNKNQFNKKNNKQSFEIIYGKNACFGCIQAYNNGLKNRSIYSIFLLQSKLDEYLKKIPKELHNLVQKCNSHDLFSITHEQDKHQGIALKVSNFHFTDIEQTIEMVENKKTKKSVIFFLDRIQDPHNVGNIIRSSFCFDIDAIILTERDSCGITPAVVRTSAGYSENSLICQVGNSSVAIEKLKKYGYIVVGFDVNTNTQDSLMNVIDKYNKLVFIFGSEGQGMKDLTKKNCDLIIKLPMNQQAESLNVANTVAIAGWEVMKAKQDNN